MRYILLSIWVIGASLIGGQTLADNTKDTETRLLDYFFAAARINDTEVLKEFIDAGVPVNVQNHKGYTALMVATYNGQREAFDYLLAAGASPCLQDKRGNTALMAAIFRGELRMAYRLTDAKCDIQQQNLAGQTAEEFARVFGRKEILEKLLTVSEG